MTATLATHATGNGAHPPPPAIRFTDVSKWYGNVVAVNGVSFALSAGITGLLGPNGAGKTTVLNLTAGFLAPSNGAVEVLGQAPTAHTSIYRQIGLVAEREAVYGFLTGFEFVRLNARLQHLSDPDAAAHRAIARVEMQAAADRATGTYSKGMKQRIKIAAAIVHEPTVLLLDEPFNGADPRQRLQMMDMLRRMAAEGCTVVFSSHILEEVERLADNVLVVVNGRLAASGDFRTIRRLMTDRPHTFTIHSSDNRRLAAALMGNTAVSGVEVLEEGLSVRAADFAAFTRTIATAARRADVTLYELLPTDESLESVFSYLVNR